MVDPAKGKFRTFLLTSLTHFLANEWDRSRAAKRGGGKTIISLDGIAAEEAYKFEPSHHVSPDQLFDKRWAVAILDQALLQLQKEFSEQEKEYLFAKLKQFLTSDPSEGDYAGVAIQTGMSSQNVAVMVFRMRKRYGELVRSAVSQTVTSPLDLEQEMRHLFQALNL
jgi:RNA polymerase sigma-70 factor (ECF subfamily)